jgi:hypothetical protein
MTTIQEHLVAFFAAHGLPLSTIGQAEASTTRQEWEALADKAIRTAPEHNRTHVAHTLKLALDSPQNGGPGLAQDFAVLPEPNLSTGETWYRGFRCPEGIGPGKPHYDTGLFWRDPAQVARRIVGLYVAREIKMPQEATIGSKA